jgi:LPXTG-site transpeptidase (sortase) family protein
VDFSTDVTQPTVTVEQSASQLDPTNVSPIYFTATFSESVIGFDATHVLLSGTAGATTVNVAEVAPNDGTTYRIAVSGMTTTGTVIVDIPANAVKDSIGNQNTASSSVDNLVAFSTDTIAPLVVFSSNTVPAKNSILLTGPTQITIEFNEDVKNDGGTGAANNPLNYLLVSAGANGVIDTVSCLGGRVADDGSVPINSASYMNNGGGAPFIATVNINGGVPLGAGQYRLFVCGTTSIEDLLGNELNNGLSDTLIDFSVSTVMSASSSDSSAEVSLPVTGFPVGHVTPLPVQPLDKTYKLFSDLWLEIPALNVSVNIVGVPLTADGWDVTWLGKDAGWLNGTAFPGWSGNSVLTAHVWDAYNQAGTFYQLKSLHYGDYIKIHAFGQVYIYEVRQSKRISPDNFNAALKHEDKAWLTLLTCEDYRLLFKTYNYRRMIRAVLVGVVDEK